jgi:hypothetical protein
LSVHGEHPSLGSGDEVGVLSTARRVDLRLSSGLQQWQSCSFLWQLLGHALW